MADKNPIREKLEKRHKERLENFKKQREIRLKDKNYHKESPDVFLESFNKEKREIIKSLNSLELSMPRVDVTSMFDEISQKMQTLQKYVSDSTSFLASYDIRRAQEILTQMRNDINERREELLPKKKFAFKSRLKLKTKTDDKEKASEIETKKDNVLNVMDNMIGFTDRSGETLTLQQAESKGNDLNLSNLDDCIVYIYGCPSAMRIRNVINTTIYCGPVSRAIFINDCFDCNFHLACQQLRIHSTVNTKFYIYVTSKAIIEDCENVGFGCYKWQYEYLTEHYIESGLNRNINNWKDVDDFNWLKLDEQSPNWYIMEGE